MSCINDLPLKPACVLFLNTPYIYPWSLDKTNNFTEKTMTICTHYYKISGKKKKPCGVLYCFSIHTISCPLATRKNNKM